MDRLRFPIGEMDLETDPKPEDIPVAVERIAALPQKLRAAVEGLTEEQLNTPYRPGGWTVAQVVHHVADSHAHSYLRFKRVLTMDNPPIEGYDEAQWAELDDAKSLEISLSLNWIDALHARFASLLRSLTPEQRARTFQHSEYGSLSLNRYFALYAWHGDHHVAHITELRKREGW